MKGDFSRDTFDSRKQFSSVLMQQGRVLLDADWNEQSAILLHYIRTLAADLIGPHAGPGSGFEIELAGENDLTIKPGRYYVDGILCENSGKLRDKNEVKDVSYFNQPYYQPNYGKKSEDRKLPNNFLVYLDVWERHITHFEDESLREVALGGVDTTTRRQVVWQVKVLTKRQGLDCNSVPATSTGLLKAKAKEDSESDEPCIIEPDARYRGAENQLYRVEIHTGNINDDEQEVADIQPTFKWSRENGAVIFPVTAINEKTVRLANLGRDERFGLCEGDWVELVDDDYTLHNRADKLLRIESIDRDEMSVTLSDKSEIVYDPENHPLLRRWDQKAGNTQKSAVDENAAVIELDSWVTLEDGVQIQFVKPGGNVPRTYRTGDYWLIPARTATGDVEWPRDSAGEPISQPPRGIKHHYAPLAIGKGNGIESHCRCTFDQIGDCPSEERKISGAGELKPATPVKKVAKVKPKK